MASLASNAEVLAQPKLQRHNTAPDLHTDGLVCCPNSGETRPMSPDEREARELARTVLRAYHAQPCKGKALTLPGGANATDDAWAALLETELSEILSTEDAVQRMRTFSAERWLRNVVEARGDSSQKATFASLLRELSFLEGVEVPADLRCGLPAHMGLVDQQPLREVEVYRSLDEADLGIPPEVPAVTLDEPPKTQDDEEEEP